jgi:hypothetical protein
MPLRIITMFDDSIKINGETPMPRVVWKADDGKEYATEVEALRAEVMYWRDKATQAHRAADAAMTKLNKILKGKSTEDILQTF